MSSLAESIMCRLCAWEHMDNQNVYEMETSITVDKSVVILAKMAELIEKNLNLKLSREDKLPRMICLDCQQAVQALSEFLVRIRRGQAYLRKLLPEQSTGDTNSISSSEEISCSVYETSPLAAFRKRGRPRKGRSESNSCLTKLDERNIETYPEENKLNIDESFQQNIKLEVASNEECDKIDLKAEQDFRCGYCFQTFLDKESYTSHIRLDHSTKIYSCNVCERVFNAESSLRYHKQANHQGDEFPCSISGCNKVFKTKIQMTRHIKFHADERPYSCNQCDKSFKCLSNLKQHEKTHSDLKLYQCELCGQEFKHKGSLNIHKQIHDQAKKFECNSCNKKFHQSGNLKEHMRSHTGDKRFSCNICKKAFGTSSQLKKHQQRIHETLSKEITVDDSFTKSANTINPRAPPIISLLTHSQPDVFSCVYCEKMFPVKKSLNVHIKSEHSDLAKKQKDERSQVWNILKSVVDQNPQTEVLEEDNQLIYITYENNEVDSTVCDNDNITTNHKKVVSGDEYPLAQYLKDPHNIPVTD